MFHSLPDVESPRKPGFLVALFTTKDWRSLPTLHSDIYPYMGVSWNETPQTHPKLRMLSMGKPMLWGTHIFGIPLHGYGSDHFATNGPAESLSSFWELKPSIEKSDNFKLYCHLVAKRPQWIPWFLWFWTIPGGSWHSRKSPDCTRKAFRLLAPESSKHTLCTCGKHSKNSRMSESTDIGKHDQRSARDLYISMFSQIWTPAAMLSSAPAREVAEVE